MKIRCDVCEKQEAAVFCGADEAALCEGCDHRVHHANKLASKHHRFSLLHPSFKDAPLCDICQEKRAFLFCREDRAILCRECDISIHKENKHSQSHNRFLLTGVRISASSTPYPNSNTYSSPSEPISKNSSSNHSNGNLSQTTSSAANYSQFSENGSISTNNYCYTMPDHMMESMPGWSLDDLLHSSFAPHYL